MTRKKSHLLLHHLHSQRIVVHLPKKGIFWIWINWPQARKSGRFWFKARLTIPGLFTDSSCKTLVKIQAALPSPYFNSLPPLELASPVKESVCVHMHTYTCFCQYRLPWQVREKKLIAITPLQLKALARSQLLGHLLYTSCCSYSFTTSFHASSAVAYGGIWITMWGNWSGKKKKIFLPFTDFR